MWLWPTPSPGCSDPRRQVARRSAGSPGRRLDGGRRRGVGRAEAEGPVGSRASPQDVRPAAQVSRGCCRPAPPRPSPGPPARSGSMQIRDATPPIRAGPGAAPANGGRGGARAARAPGSSSGAAEGVPEPAEGRALSSRFRLLWALLRGARPGMSTVKTCRVSFCLAEQQEGNFLGFPHSELAV